VHLKTLHRIVRSPCNLAQKVGNLVVSASCHLYVFVGGLHCQQPELNIKPEYITRHFL
jgi:hypothetical protein